MGARRRSTRPHRRPRRVQIAAALGIVIGLYLIAQLRVEIPEIDPPAPAPVPVAELAPAPQVTQAVTPPPRPVRRAPPPRETTGPTEPGTLEVEVVDRRGGDAGSVFIQPVDCTWSPLGSEGRVRRYAVQPGSCALRATRKDGALRASSETVKIDIASGEIAFVRLEMPNTRTGGIGINFRRTDDGVYVLRVVPESPAAKAGLKPGDRIVSVDGTDTADLDSDGFVGRMTGPEGSRVTFEVEYRTSDGFQVDRVVVERQYLSG